MRWTAKLKEGVLKMLATGEMTPEEAHALYGLSTEELEQWQRLYAAHGVKGLRARHLQKYRPRFPLKYDKIIAARDRSRRAQTKSKQ